MNKDNSLLEVFWKGLTVSIIIGIVIISFTYLVTDYPNKTSTTVNISFIKDVYSAIFTVFAPYIAIYLFNDWKDQHNKNIYSTSASKILEKYQNIFLALTKISNIKEQIQDFDKFKFNGSSERHAALNTIGSEFMENRRLIDKNIKDLVIDTGFFTTITQDSKLLSLIFDFKKGIIKVMTSKNEKLLEKPNLSENELKSFIIEQSEGFNSILENFNTEIVDELRKYIKA